MDKIKEVMENIGNNNSKQEQIQDLLFNREIGWQEIIYDLINTEQLDPWDINITLLSDRYLEKIKELEEADFFISGKVLLAASLLLRIKSEILLNKYIKSIDEILFGNKNKGQSEISNDLRENPVLGIEFEESMPELIPKSPVPRFKKVTLQELMDSLNKAIVTENRRIKRKISEKNALRESSFSMPKSKIRVKDRIKDIYKNLLKNLRDDQRKMKVSFTEIVGEKKEDRVFSFYPLLHLEHQQKIWLEQEGHFEEVYIWLKDVYFKNNPNPFEGLNEDIEKEIEELKVEKKKRINKNNKVFENPLGKMFD
ncbi:segregation/condensation protein A [Patescibacteria group bacterium]|nr:segregation/condensation protein A [Patescibacteria group bacterium]